MPRKTRHDPDVLRGMALGPWALHWADREEQRGRTYPGENLTEVCSRPPKWARQWAERLADAIVELNGASLLTLYENAVNRAGYREDEEAFGIHLALQATGSGSSWKDSAVAPSNSPVGVPSDEFYEGARPDLRFVRE